MAKYQRKNNQTIDKAIASFVKRGDEIILGGMCELLTDAVNYALSIHDDEHQQHLEIGDTYGWALVREGKVVAMEIDGHRTMFERAIAKTKRFFEHHYDSMDNPKLKYREGQTARSLREKASQVTKRGYVGIVMAGMKATHTWFSVDYESGILLDTSSNIEKKFKTYFKPIR